MRGVLIWYMNYEQYLREVKIRYFKLIRASLDVDCEVNGYKAPELKQAIVDAIDAILKELLK